MMVVYYLLHWCGPDADAGTGVGWGWVRVGLGSRVLGAHLL